MGIKPNAADHTKTGDYVGENRKLDARLCAKRFHDFAEKNAAAPTVQLQRMRTLLSVIAYRNRNFRVMDVLRAFLMSGPVKTRDRLETSKCGSIEKFGL